MPSKPPPSPPPLSTSPPLDPLTTVWPAGVPFYRVHSARRTATVFNPGYGQGRFHPLNDADGRPVPTLYGADNIDGALAETVFRGVPAVGTLRGIRRHSLTGLALSVLAPRRKLRLIDLRGHELRRLGLTRNQLLETDAEHYHHTARWAAALHHALPTTDGLIWVSRQFDTASVMLLFGDRIKPQSLSLIEPPLSLYRGRGYQQVLAIAEQAGLIVLN